MLLTTLLTTLSFSSLFTLANAGPVDTLDVYAPLITYPSTGTIWKVGDIHNVTWDTSDPPKQITNEHGRIQLRKGPLTTPLILANHFDILDGTVEVTVPWVVDGDDYTVVLFGDSGNPSATFTITGA